MFPWILQYGIYFQIQGKLFLGSFLKTFDNRARDLRTSFWLLVLHLLHMFLPKLNLREWILCGSQIPSQNIECKDIFIFPK